ncbi:MAG: DUF4397 domain-containing protein [Candidatus Pedobacter colombiensis]|uniref:DUF4397 domain-containing protein n=1 Tax=Candidatus Pedobacter colombiensis TaxID=3121371 RepID=A0AAJ5W764_9SPHI|nr:DUF4397 domain-containing protein [Pedobacter sp.]WEK19371.1 MAG: DUF4397 domain-containing protein [Pedobacter sp.]
MKNVNNLKTILKAFIAVLTVSVVFIACSKDKYEPQQVAGLSIINAFPAPDSLDFYIDQTRANNKALKFNSKIDYLNLFPGNRALSVAKRGSNRALISERFNLLSGVGYSIFVLDTVNTNTKKYLLTEDDLSAPATDKAKVRFINLSKDAPALSLIVNGKDTNLFTDKAFYEYTTFTTVDPGESVTFNVKAGDVVKTILPNVKIEKGKIYTIYAKGISTATVDSLKLGVAIYTHK